MERPRSANNPDALLQMLKSRSTLALFHYARRMRTSGPGLLDGFCTTRTDYGAVPASITCLISRASVNIKSHQLLKSYFDYFPNGVHTDQ